MNITHTVTYKPFQM